MAIFKCKMCGGSLEIGENTSVAVCEYCGTKQTLPKLDDNRRANMYDRANQLRRNNEFDKAMGIYEQILSEDNTDAEAYWSLVLCRYGIEYVEDPASHKRIPTVNRAQLTSIFSDEDYKSALEYADVLQREIFEAEATAINNLQKNILAISQKAEPFDVFICYKESDGIGNRTVDSVLAAELYRELEREGIRTFFSRITLEDELGSAYEPYIFAALHSARVMVVVGTKPEHFNAVWVKNEWSRYLALMNDGARKTVIPVYKDMDPYDLPEQFAYLQAQDMGKIGAMQDLVRGIKKIVTADEPKPAPAAETASAGSANIAPLLKRAFMFLEDEDWNSANEYCEKVLDLDPENAQAYLGKLMSDLQIRTQSALKNHPVPFDGNNNYIRALRFADPALKQELAGAVAHIKDRNETARKEGIYQKALASLAAARTMEEAAGAADMFRSIGNYKDSIKQIVRCEEVTETIRKNELYQKAEMFSNHGTIPALEKAIILFEKIPNWKDSLARAADCKNRIQQINDRLAHEAEELRKRKEEEKRIAKKRARRNLIALLLTVAAVCVVIIAAGLSKNVIIPNTKYNKAVNLMDDGEYEEAIAIFSELGEYKDSAEQIDECKQGILELQAKDQIKALGDPKVGDTVKFGMYEQDNDIANGAEEIEWIVLDKQDGKILVISKYGLGATPYNTEYTSVTWETCTLRDWLNNNFYNTAFGETHQAMIEKTTVSAEDNKEYNTDAGNYTSDHVFLLSTDEAKRYFSTSDSRACKPTAVAQGVYVNFENGNCGWWLRSPGCSRDSAAYVYNDGDVNEYGDRVDLSGPAVRPALWIDLNS